MTPFNTFSKNMARSQILSILFAASSYACLVTFHILLEIDAIPMTVRGFFCSDNSIKYPYQKQTVSGGLLFLISFAGVVFTFTLGETSAASTNASRSYKKHHLGVTSEDNSKRNERRFGNHLWYIRVIKIILMCWWSTAATMLVTSLIKSVVGKPRPNFLAVCNPNITCTSNNTQYNIEYVCQGTELMGNWKRLAVTHSKGINQARRSFPSGHASYVASMATFAILYIEKRLRTTNRFPLLIPLLEIMWICFAAFVSTSRISDYYHDLGDVIFGSLLGITITLIIGVHIMTWLINLKSCRDKDVSMK